MNSLDLMGLSQNDFTWYNVGKVDDWVARNIPQVVDEYTADGEDITIMIVNQTEVPNFDSFQMAFWFRDAYLPLYENGDFYIKADGSLAAKKHSDGYALLGVRNES